MTANPLTTSPYSAEFREKFDLMCQSIGVVEKSAFNSFYNAHYTDLNNMLEKIGPIILESGFLLTQSIDINEFGPMLITQLTYHLSGEFRTIKYPLLPNVDPQKFAASVTYARRQSLRVLLKMVEMDDDGNKAAGHDEPKPVPQQQPAYKPQHVAPSGVKSEAPITPAPAGGKCRDCGAETTVSLKTGRPYVYCKPCGDKRYL